MWLTYGVLRFKLYEIKVTILEENSEIVLDTILLISPKVY